MSEPILSVENLTKHFPITKGLIFSRTVGYVRAIDGVDLSVYRGETLSLVGESGCGKTTTAFCMLQLYPMTSGTIRLEGTDITTLQGKSQVTYRKSVQAVFQDPYDSLSPRQLVRDIIAEPLVANTDMTKAERRARVLETIAQVGLLPDAADLYPHEFSGGQRQRVALARALALKPKLIVLDEPVSALDVSIRASVMNLLRDLQQEVGVAYLLISHDLAGVRYMSHRVAVMYLGKIVETAPGEELFDNPLHPYTRALLAATLPAYPQETEGPANTIVSGEVPSPINIPRGCRFHTRCPHAKPICSEREPELKEAAPNHLVACHLYTSDDA